MTPRLDGDCLAEREAFEAWLPEFWTRQTFTDDEGDKTYCQDWVQGAWVGWCAALSASKQGGKAEGWISVDERLPGEQGQDSEQVLCFLSGHCAMTDFECRGGAGWGIRLGYYDAEKGMFRTGGRPDASVTHWMPLPLPPAPAAQPQGDSNDR